MSEVKISAEPRTEFGKGGARRTRRAGKVPAVLYGHGEKPKHIALPAREFAAAIRKGGANQLFAIEISDGTQVLALPKAIQRDPIRDTFEHVDLLLVRRGEKVTVEVPVQLTGEAARDTLIVHDHDTLSVTADATKVPDHLEASIEGLEAGTPGHRRRRRAARRRRAGRRLGPDGRLGDRRADRRAARGDPARGRGRRRRRPRPRPPRARRPPRPARLRRRGRGEHRGEDRGLIGSHRSRQASPVVGGACRRIGAPAAGTTASGRDGT